MTGELLLAYDTAAISMTTETLYVGGDLVQVQVPVPGQVDLAALRRLPGIDLAVAPGLFLVEPANAPSGTPLELKATVANVGSFAAANVPVEFQANGGSIGTVAIPGPIAALDPAGTLGDADLSNNSAVLSDAFLPDAILDSIQVARLTSKTYSFIARVRNGGGLELPAGGTVKLFVESKSGPLLATWTFPSALPRGAHHDLSITASLVTGSAVPFELNVVAAVEAPAGVTESDPGKNERLARAISGAAFHVNVR